MSEHTSTPGLTKDPNALIQLFVDEASVIAAMTLVLGIQAVSAYINKLIHRRRYRSLWRFKTESHASKVATEIRALTNASRVVFCYFHNNEITLSGLHLKKLTAYVESLSPGVESVMSQVQRIPITRLLAQIEQLLDGEWKIIQRDDVEPGGCLRHLIQIGVHTQAEKIVFHRGVPVVLVTIQFFDKRPNLRVRDLAAIKDLVAQLSEAH